jgi:hypothetical protein
MYVLETEPEPQLTQFFMDVKATLQSIPGHKLLVIDSCYDFIRFQGKAKISEDHVNAVFKGVLNSLCEETDTTILVIWHPSQAGLERGDGTGWSVAWENAPRARLVLEKDKTSGIITLTVQKRSHGPDGHSIKLSYSEGALVTENEADAVERRAHIYNAVIRLAVEYAEYNQPLNRKTNPSREFMNRLEKANGFKIKEKDIRDCLERAVSDKRLEVRGWSRKQPAGYYPPANGLVVSPDLEQELEFKEANQGDNSPNETVH